MGNKELRSKQREEGKAIPPPHPMMNNTVIIRKDQHYLIKSEWPYFTQEQYQKWSHIYLSFLRNAFQVDNFDKIAHPIARNLFLPLSHHYQKVNVCSPTGIVTMNYQIVDKTLADDIQERRKKNLPYLEQQLWSLLDVLSQNIAYLHSRSISLGDIRTQNVVIGVEEKVIKISIGASWVGEPDIEVKILNNWEVFVIPDILESRRNNKNIDNTLLIPNNDFQVGMVLAESILLEDLSKIYEINKGDKVLNQQKHRDLVERLLGVKYYSRKLLLLIVGMIQLNSKRRVKCSQICQLLQNQRESLKEMKKMNISKQKMIKVLEEKYNVLEQTVASIDSKSSKISFGRKFYSTFLPSNNFTEKSQVSEKSQPIRPANTNTIPQEFNRFQDMKLEDLIALSNNKQTYTASFLPYVSADQTNLLKPYEPETSLNIEQNKDISKNFSFNSLESPQPPDEVEKTMTKPVEPNSFGKSTQTLLIAPSVYSVRNPPESYISYHYTQSLSKNKPKIEKEHQKSLESSFQFQQEMEVLKRRKQSQRKNEHILINDLKRRTISVSVASWEKKEEREEEQY